MLCCDLVISFESTKAQDATFIILSGIPGRPWDIIFDGAGASRRPIE